MAYGGNGDDRVAGYIGNDLQYGGSGNDFMRGGDGQDRLSGGGGNDTYNYQFVSHSPAGVANRDVILDFSGVGGAGGDRIDLAEMDANTGTPENDQFAFVRTAAFTAPGQVRVVNIDDGHTLIQANTSGTSGAEFEIVVHDGNAGAGSWVAEDFIL